MGQDRPTYSDLEIPKCYDAGVINSKRGPKHIYSRVLQLLSARWPWTYIAVRGARVALPTPEGVPAKYLRDNILLRAGERVTEVHWRVKTTPDPEALSAEQSAQKGLLLSEKYSPEEYSPEVLAISLYNMPSLEDDFLKPCDVPGLKIESVKQTTGAYLPFSGENMCLDFNIATVCWDDKNGLPMQFFCYQIERFFDKLTAELSVDFASKKKVLHCAVSMFPQFTWNRTKKQVTLRASGGFFFLETQ